jgi:hypothetical protein
MMFEQTLTLCVKGAGGKCWLKVLVDMTCVEVCSVKLTAKASRLVR